MSYSMMGSWAHFWASQRERNRELGGSSKVIKRMENKSLEERIKEMGMNLKENKRRSPLNMHIFKQF